MSSMNPQQLVELELELELQLVEFLLADRMQNAGTSGRAGATSEWVAATGEGECCSFSSLSLSFFLLMLFLPSSECSMMSSVDAVSRGCNSSFS